MRALDKIEELNLTLQVLDGILAHNGEAHDFRVEPQTDKTWEMLDGETARCQRQHDGYSGIMPMTMEGCVVRVSDTISYVGRDIEDAITLGLVSREDIPRDCAEVLGSTNRDIVNNLVVDVIENSYNQPYIALSPDTAKALRELKDFNHACIYSNKEIKNQSVKIQRMFSLLFDSFLDDLKAGRKESRIFTNYIAGFSPEKWKRYANGMSEPEIVRDFISGMTDEFFNDTFRELYLPQKKSMY